ncbi:Holliday junction DNA helicase RuvA [Alkalibacillus filiformis]|uniref:Holliday junction branch migration complex subunit RuvA n=1 Tax=Alkalibacillus filiformis TaxID=200990 RepID=A0ABU0DRR5_9BACI|nr:Holliday junction branch migration protein RuvA [Alkalibacillus filiformis]MDQ0351142.1 Holliday junction DNA helicase RuvA [Alkalibacillus filiformis]
MYSYIEGELKSVTEDYIVIDVSGIGYEIWCPNPLRFQTKIEEVVKVYTYFYVREDTQMLYGFKLSEEKDLFKKLLNVSGIGPKNALSIVSQTTVQDFAKAIEQENDAYLTKFPGVGKKTARQMILDLKGKVDEWMQVSSDDILTIETEIAPSNHQLYDEAIEALLALGYTKRELDKIAPQLKAQQTNSTDDLVKHGLQLLMR